MKEIKAYVRAERINSVVRALKAAAVPRMAVLHVRAVGNAIDPSEAKRSMESVSNFMDMVKIEIVSHDDQVGNVVDIIGHEGRTGRRDDGVIYVRSVDAAVEIRTGERNPDALT